ncbi:MAG TPA: hypothetical protein VMB21_02455 [Candidatus Limnocylindria bacterium]|jgi:hypothetical protein|nr:hypothetical protein [Candidatus Limnocylindria bacterium]
MKKVLARYSLCLLVMAAVFAGAVYWRDEHYTGNAITVLLMWPTTVLALNGVVPSWPASVAVWLVLPAITALLLRSKPLLISVIVTVIVSCGFCYAGAFHTKRLTSTKPSANPYPTGSANAIAYAEGYGLGYAYAVTGSWVTHCFSPEDETRGYYQGQEDGGQVFNRAFGLPEHRGRALIRRSAEVDGVRTLKPAL